MLLETIEPIFESSLTYELLFLGLKWASKLAGESLRFKVDRVLWMPVSRMQWLWIEFDRSCELCCSEIVEEAQISFASL